MKLLLVLDLDFTHFNSDKTDICWLGSAAFWQNLYQNVTQMAQQAGVELILSVVSHKSGPDDLIPEVAIAFKTLFYRHNPNMYHYFNNREWHLINDHGQLYYFDFYQQPGSRVLACSQDNVASIYCTALNKSVIIKKLADYHEITLDCCILIDDSPTVISDAMNHGIHVVPAPAFYHSATKGDGMLDNLYYVNQTLADIREKLITKVADCLKKLVGPNYRLPLQKWCQLPEASYWDIASYYKSPIINYLYGTQVAQTKITQPITSMFNNIPRFF